MANIDRSFSRLPLIGGAVAILLVLGAGGAFLRLGMTATPPAQTMVHKDLSGAAFASSAPQAALPAMPPVPTAQPAQAAAPASAPVATSAAPVPAAPAATLTPSTPLPTMPAPKAAPTQSMPAAAPVAPASAH